MSRQQLQARWRALAPRDRRALLALGTVLCALLLYLLAWQPGRQRHAAAREDFARQRALLGYLAQNAPRAAQAAAMQVDAAGLQALVTRSAAAAGLPLDQLETDAQGQLRLAIQHAGFASLQAWLRQLQAQGVQLVSAEIERTGDGVVGARLVLRAGR